MSKENCPNRLFKFLGSSTLYAKWTFTWFSNMQMQKVTRGKARSLVDKWFLPAVMVTSSTHSKATILSKHHATNRNYPRIKPIDIKPAGSPTEGVKSLRGLISMRLQHPQVPAGPVFGKRWSEHRGKPGRSHFSGRAPPTALEQPLEPSRWNSLLPHSGGTATRSFCFRLCLWPRSRGTHPIPTTGTAGRSLCAPLRQLTAFHLPFWSRLQELRATRALSPCRHLLEPIQEERHRDKG